ncbi:CD83 antigen precursor [Danio rerio]|uniref:CD83 antigen precursor n=1 Tax=Danio rerio TaxID=7955 RepID=A0A8M1NEQ7_DANRE|nr:CD83 antigen precursor [Danio rerio]AAI62161.1 Si:ch211-149p10.2 [Danio rerio]AAI62524.1 Si:ch211-149p10.2 [Danio rerio]AGZ05741.1 CD83 antigen [Danio rerio]
MRRFSELIVCLVTLVVAEDQLPEIRAIAGEDAVLRCSAKSETGVQYRSVIWYKVDEAEPSQQLTGLVRKRLTEDDGKVEKYNGVEREVVLLEDSKNLILSNVTAEDSGIYRCFLSAPLGYQNQRGDIILTVYKPQTVERMEFNKSSLVYLGEIAAIAGLFLGFLFFGISYVYIRSFNQRGKKLSLLKMPSPGKNLITSNHLICKTLPEVYV